MVVHRLKSLEKKLVRLDGASLSIKPENSSEFTQIKQILGQRLYSKLF